MQNPMSRAVLDFLPGERVGERYNRLVAYVRANFDPRFVGGGASVREIDRVEKALANFEAEAKRKVEDAARARANEPEAIAYAKLHALWHKGNDACMAISRLRAKIEEHRWRPEWKVLALPREFFDEPEGVGREVPSFKTLEEADEVAAELGAKVSVLVGLKSKMEGLIGAWDAGADKFSLKMFEALHGRLLALEKRLK